VRASFAWWKAIRQTVRKFVRRRGSKVEFPRKAAWVDLRLTLVKITSGTAMNSCISDGCDVCTRQRCMLQILLIIANILLLESHRKACPVYPYLSNAVCLIMLICCNSKDLPQNCIENDTMAMLENNIPITCCVLRFFCPQKPTSLRKLNRSDALARPTHDIPINKWQVRAALIKQTDGIKPLKNAPA